MGLLDALLSGNTDGGGLLSFLQNNALNQQPAMGLPSDQAQYGSPPLGAQPPVFQQPNAPSPLDNAQWPAGPVGAPSQANAQMPVPQQPPPIMAQPQAPVAQQAPDTGLGIGDRLSQGFKGMAANMPAGPIGMLMGGVAGLAGMGQGSVANQTAKALLAKGVDPVAVQAAIANPELMKTLITQAYGPQTVQSLGEGYIADKNGKITRAYEPDDKTPQSVLEYNYYKDHLPPGQPPMDYATFSTAKARASATNINNNVDMNSGQTYDKQLAEGLGKAHSALANGVEDSQARARDIAAMQGAVDAIQKNGGTTGGLAPAQRLELQKSINAGAAALGIGKPFEESDLSDKEFLTKFNRSMAGAQAKNSVGSRVTNFEMSNFLKANPGLDMTLTGNQRLLGIQGQIENRNIAVGNSIRDATAAAISSGKKIDPVTVQKIITDYDTAHHIKDPVTGQDLTQSYALPEFQNTPTNASMAGAHSENLKTMEKTIGGVTYQQRNGNWYPKR